MPGSVTKRFPVFTSLHDYDHPDVDGNPKFVGVAINMLGMAKRCRAKMRSGGSSGLSAFRWLMRSHRARHGTVTPAP